MVRKMEQSTTRDVNRKLERAEGGDGASAKQIEKAETSAPESTEAVEQEAADGPKGRGLAR
jgi:hypothetical protein